MPNEANFYFFLLNLCCCVLFCNCLGHTCCRFISAFWEHATHVMIWFRVLSLKNIRQDTATHLASIKTVFQPLRGEKTGGWVMLARWRWTQERGRQTWVFISIILHNNTVVLQGTPPKKEKKRENRCNKRSPGDRRPYLEKCLFIRWEWKHMWFPRMQQL